MIRLSMRRVGALLVAPLMALMLTFSTTGAMAQDGDPAPAAAPAGDKELPSMGFKAGGEIPKEDLPGWPFLYGAYSFIWFFIFAYIVFLWRRQAALTARIAQVDRRLDQIDQALDAMSGRKS